MLEASTMSIPGDGDALRILLVEDDADCAASTAMLLRLYGHAVDVAVDGLTALERATAARPDVILLDIGLPRLNGCEVARRLSANRPAKTPLLIAVTGLGNGIAQRRSEVAGIDLYLVKPIDVAKLQIVLEKFRHVISV